LKSKVSIKSFGRRDSAGSQVTSGLAGITKRLVSFRIISLPNELILILLEAIEKDRARNEKLLQEFKDSLPPGSPYKEKIFGNEYTMDTIPFVNETSKEYQERVRKVQIKKNHILVLIPSYRDPDCHNTITDLFERCKFCDRISVGMITPKKLWEESECVMCVYGRVYIYIYVCARV
jgi:hypothetical protein